MAIITFDNVETKKTGSVCISGQKGEAVYSIQPTECDDCPLGLITAVILLEDCTEVNGQPYGDFDTSLLRAGCGVSLDTAKGELSLMSPEDYSALISI